MTNPINPNNGPQWAQGPSPTAVYQPAYSTVPGAVPAYLIPPTIASTLLITLFFGLFGLIPAFTHTSRARAMGMATNKYWITFWSVFGGWVLLVLLASSGS